MTFSARRSGLGSSSHTGATLTARMRRRTYARRIALLLLGISLPLGSMGCDDDTAKNIGDYFNFRNSLMSPNEVGRFDKEHPWGNVKPVKFPILDQLDVIDEPVDPWASATEPTSADLVPEIKEYVLSTGDTIRIGIFEFIVPGTDFVQERKINELGYINLQNLGPVLVSGLTPTQLEQKIIQMCIEQKLLPPPGPGQPGPQVDVTVEDSRARVFSVLGAAGRPGTYNVLSSDFRLLDALALVGDVPVQPGMDYLYIIRQVPYAPSTTPSAPMTPNPTGGSTGPAANPLDTLEGIDKANPADTAPAPATAPTPAPTSGPASNGGPAIQLVRPLPTADVAGAADPMHNALAAGDLDAALGMPGTAPATAPAATQTSGKSSADTKALENALGNSASDSTTRFVFIDGRWVPIQVKNGTTAATLPGIAVTPAPTGTQVASTQETPGSTSAENLVQQRIIRIPIEALRDGVSKYNIVIRPGDVINVPAPTVGEFYMMGHVSRPGVYSLTGRKITLKQAVAAAGNLDSLAIPRRCDLIRRIGKDQEAIVAVNLQKIFDGEQPDIFLKADDVVNVGTDLVASFLLVTRNAYRASYGWAFVYDRNLEGNNNNGS